MKKVLVIYYSRTGNTEKWQKWLTEGLVQKGIVVDLKNVNEVDIDSLPDYDGYIIGP